MAAGWLGFSVAYLPEDAPVSDDVTGRLHPNPGQVTSLQFVPLIQVRMETADTKRIKPVINTAKR